jgi:hypothetical protein
VFTYLNYSFFYSSLSKENKEKIINGFLLSFKDYYFILINTSNLQKDFNYSFIKLVIYKNITYSFLSFLQGSSRGRKDNRLNTFIFFYNFKDFKLLNPFNLLSSFNTSFIRRLRILKEDKALGFNYLRESIYY